MGDLDAIVLMALRHQSGARYATVEDLRLDLQRFLDGEMVMAQDDSITTRTVKFVRRNRLAVAATFLLAFAGGFGGWQAIEARIQRERANNRESELQQAIASLSMRLPDWSGAGKTIPEEQKVEDVRKFRETIGKELKESLTEQPGLTPARAELMNSAMAYLNLAEKLSNGSPKVQKELAAAYQTVADVQGHPADRNTLGDRRAAVENYKRAAKLVEEVHQTEPNPELEQRLAVLNSRLVQLGESQPRSIWTQPGASVPVASAPAQTRVAARKEESRASSEPAQQTPVETPAPPLSPQPVQEPEPAISAEMRQRYALIKGQVENARSVAEPIRKKLEADGLSLNSTTSRQLVLMQVSLDSAREAIERGDAAAAKENLDRADAVSRQVLKYFGQ
jgi:hypothetical protein